MKTREYVKAVQITVKIAWVRNILNNIIWFNWLIIVSDSNNCIKCYDSYKLKSKNICELSCGIGFFEKDGICFKCH
jgi:hypothetical protein